MISHRGVVWHGMMGRAWSQLEKCICSLWFLSRCVQEFGVHATRDTLDSVATAASHRKVGSNHFLDSASAQLLPRFFFVLVHEDGDEGGGMAASKHCEYRRISDLSRGRRVMMQLPAGTALSSTRCSCPTT